MSVYDYEVTLIDGKQIWLSEYRGKVLLIVNTASKCGFSRQFADMQKLYEKRKEQGFEILAFPCNQFNGKEPGGNSEIQSDCESNFGVTFPLFEKTDVRGPTAHPLFLYFTREAPFQGFDLQTEDGQWMKRFLQEKYPDIYAGDGIKWKFSKFLIDRGGRVVRRYESTVETFAIDHDIESLL